MTMVIGFFELLFSSDIIREIIKNALVTIIKKLL
ncbi:hypothetical protein DGI_3375 [Megalodesulfovibrio gigas DSM 1382 = ATCC 19364]|uniref:Uncharacterized protein n=1 Tax=Megalodesulfovibrio gigas (strain ATCC 19364 / DSM 1382 / NCIMB 9332 / VKM B-1759) TaxID=1121448 RepID=T2GFV3_MEGG1|nr:hypothetical protein DGI_2088 [Megalodesulfovibrio gigas DSM 1382 = ATCC 19364]AGW15064.1 hypothetical protein DGI_3375 [Megalodesulfovibrio gigas DSM 1382 = ATCC 19364]